MDLFDRLSLALPRLRLLREEPLAAHTSFRIGGPAEVMAFPSSLAELQALLRLSAQEGIRVRLLGAGTNILAPDGGVRGLVIVTSGALTGLSMPDAAHIEAMSGVTMARLACFARDNGLTGLEFAAGAYGGEIRAVCRWSQEMLPDGTLVRREGVSQGFGYRTSVFQHTDGVIVRACFALQPGDPGIIRETMRELMTRRTVSQPLDLPSAGSAFKRPQGGYAAALIESAGLKGLTVGGAQVSEKHAGFVVNRGGATAADVLELLRQVQQRVLEHSGIRLEPEIRLWD